MTDDHSLRSERRTLTAAADGAALPSHAAGHAIGVLCLVLALAGCAGAGGRAAEVAVAAVANATMAPWCGNRIDQDQDNLISPQEWDDAFRLRGYGP